MAGIIVAFMKPDEGRAIKNLLVRNGYDVAAVCASGSQVINMADRLRDGVIVCGYKLADMQYLDIWENTKDTFEMILIASPAKIMECGEKSISCLQMPLKVQDLINTVELQLVVSARQRKKRKAMPKVRTEEENKIIEQAKYALMEKNNMTENEAHRYIQKKSMDNGDSFVDTAKSVLKILYRNN